MPFYKTIKAEKGRSYTPGTVTHWRLEVRGNTFSVEVDGKKSLFRKDNRHQEPGYIGFTISSQQGVFFDNLLATDILSVEKANLMSSTWAKLKSKTSKKYLKNENIWSVSF